MAEESITLGTLVIYEHQGAPLLAKVTSQGKKYSILNERGRTIQLAANRLYLLPDKPTEEITAEGLAALHAHCQTESSNVSLEELWSTVSDVEREYSNKELTELFFDENSLESHLILRLALVNDKIYFKRRKNGFIPRATAHIEELKKAQAAEAQKEIVRTLFIDTLAKKLTGSNIQWPEETSAPLTLLEEFAADSSHLTHTQKKEVKALLELCKKSHKVDLQGHLEQQAYALLKRVGHFNKYTNLSLIRYRVPGVFSEELKEEAFLVEDQHSTIQETNKNAHCHLLDNTQESGIFNGSGDISRIDLTHLKAITIDDINTKDMDDALSIEHTDNGYQLGIHVSDVAAFIQPGSPLDQEARARATSLYLNDQTIHMFPEELAEKNLSLVVGEVRPCLSCLCEIDKDCQIISTKIIQTLIKIDQRFSYEEVDSALENRAEEFTVFYNIACNREMLRIEQGGANFPQKQISVVPEKTGGLALLTIDEFAPGRNLVGEMMILFNEACATFAAENKLPFVYRHQKQASEEGIARCEAVPPGPAKEYALRSCLKPSGTSLTPALHSTLGLKKYGQITSPIRRYVDLCNQRQILNCLQTGTALYSVKELKELLQSLHLPLQTAHTVTKETKRFWLLAYLAHRARTNPEIGATVLRTDRRTPLLQLDEILMPTLVKLPSSFKPGDHLTLRITHVDPPRLTLRLTPI